VWVTFLYSPRAFRFHSISFPSEWGHGGTSPTGRPFGFVSIQLVSPASGDERKKNRTSSLRRVSIQLVSPASGDLWGARNALVSLQGVSIQLVSPASGDLSPAVENVLGHKFPFN